MDALHEHGEVVAHCLLALTLREVGRGGAGAPLAQLVVVAAVPVAVAATLAPAALGQVKLAMALTVAVAATPVAVVASVAVLTVAVVASVAMLPVLPVLPVLSVATVATVARRRLLTLRLALVPAVARRWRRRRRIGRLVEQRLHVQSAHLSRCARAAATRGPRKGAREATAASGHVFPEQAYVVALPAKPQ